MSNSKSATIGEKRKAAADKATFDSVFKFFMDFADKADAIVKPFQEDEDRFEELPVEQKEDVIKGVFGEIIGNLLERLPDEGKEDFLVKCFQDFMNKLPEKSRTAVNAKMKKKRSGGQEEEADTPIRKKARIHFPAENLTPVNYTPDSGPSDSRFNVRGPNVVRSDDDDDDDE